MYKEKTRIGILVDKIDASQQSFYLIKNINKICEDPFLDIIVFYKEWILPPVTPHFAVMNEKQAWSYDAPIFATSLVTAEKLLSFPVPTKKFFYIWDLEWIDLENYSYNNVYNIYCNPGLELIARSDYHKEIIEKVWNRKVHAVIEDFNHEQYSEIIRKQNIKVF